MALDSLQAPPYYLAPMPAWPVVLVDEQRVLIADPVDGSVVGFDGPRGAAGSLGLLSYATRATSSRGF